MNLFIFIKVLGSTTKWMVDPFRTTSSIYSLFTVRNCDTNSNFIPPIVFSGSLFYCKRSLNGLTLLFMVRSATLLCRYNPCSREKKRIREQQVKLTVTTALMYRRHTSPTRKESWKESRPMFAKHSSWGSHKNRQASL